MTSQNTSVIIEGNWDKLKGRIKKHWGKLTNDDLSVMEGSYDNLIGKLKESYGFTAKEAESEVVAFVDDLGKFKDKLEVEAESFTEETLASLSSSLEKCQERISEVESMVVSYVKKNPVKTAGIAAVVGFVAAKLFSSKK